MFASKFVAVLLAAASFVAAAPSPSSAGQCTTGPQQCCQQIQPAGAPSKASDPATGLISLLLQSLNVPIGIDCTPIPIVGVLAGGSGCSAAPVCCDSTQDASGSLVGINCIPISL